MINGNSKTNFGNRKQHVRPKTFTQVIINSQLPLIKSERRSQELYLAERIFLYSITF